MYLFLLYAATDIDEYYTPGFVAPIILFFWLGHHFRKHANQSSTPQTMVALLSRRHKFSHQNVRTMKPPLLSFSRKSQREHHCIHVRKNEAAFRGKLGNKGSLSDMFREDVLRDDTFGEKVRRPLA